MPAPKQRSSNLELLRIIAMLAIIAYHFGTQSAIAETPRDTLPSFLAIFSAASDARASTCLC